MKIINMVKRYNSMIFRPLQKIYRNNGKEYILTQLICYLIGG